MTALLQAIGVSRRFGGLLAVSDVARAKSCVALISPCMPVRRSA
jgi:ABC-type branched-subunit amino acid transport system ATPase component